MYILLDLIGRAHFYWPHYQFQTIRTCKTGLRLKYRPVWSTWYISLYVWNWQCIHHQNDTISLFPPCRNNGNEHTKIFCTSQLMYPYRRAAEPSLWIHNLIRTNRKAAKSSSLVCSIPASSRWIGGAREQARIAVQINSIVIIIRLYYHTSYCRLLATQNPDVGLHVHEQMQCRTCF